MTNDPHANLAEVIPEAIEVVIVNGAVTIDHGRHTGARGAGAAAWPLTTDHLDKK